jgi:hypothetical protein
VPRARARPRGVSASRRGRTSCSGATAA